MEKKKTVMSYPMEYLSEAYIPPRSMRKNELAQLLDLPWQVVKREISADEDLHTLLKHYRYKPSLRFLYQSQVAVLFMFFGPPLASERNKKIYRRINAQSDLMRA